MKSFRGKGWMLAAGSALSLHLLLFVAVQPSRTSALTTRTAPPHSRYMDGAAGAEADLERMVRTVRSPVLFSLPAAVGFSRELLNNDVQTRLSFMQSVKPEHFLDDSAVSREFSETIVPVEQVLTLRHKELILPGPVVAVRPQRGVVQRVVLAPELRARLVGGVLLPAELNRPVETPWEVHAEISVSEQGAVKHVLLDQPLEYTDRNHQIIRLLYGLRFKAGEAIESHVYIYSPEPNGSITQ